MSNAPAYQMYAGDWLGSRNVRFMADYQRGWYIQLLNDAWACTPQCMLPKDDAELQRIAEVSDLTRSQPDFNDRWAAVKRMFKVEGSYVYNERQMLELAKQTKQRADAVKAGHASAKRRAEKRDELQRIKKEHLAKGNGRSTTVADLFNDNSTLQASTSISKLPSSRSKRKPPNPQGGYTLQFETWWEGYPNKVCKAAGFKAWKKALKRTTIEEMTAGVERYKKQKPDDVSWCNPATWLNDDRWFDQPAAADQTAVKETDQGILDYAAQWNRESYSGILDEDKQRFFEKVRDSYGPGGAARVKAAAKRLRVDAAGMKKQSTTEGVST